MSAVNKFKNRLQDKLKQQAQNKANNIGKSILENIIDFTPLDNLSKNEDTKKLLKENSIKLLATQSKTVIEIGKILSEVYDELARTGSKEGIYTKWLEFNGISPRTALNYRKRYSLYFKVKDDKKVLVTMLPQKIIESILISNHTQEYIELINNGMNKEKLIEKLEAETIKPSAILPKVYLKDIEFENFKHIFENLEERLKDLDDKKMKELNGYLKKIKKILEN
jgi:hypothetical protein